MALFRRKPTPTDLYRAYTDGLPGSPVDRAAAELMLERGNVLPCTGPETESIRGLHKEHPRVLLFKALRELDPPRGRDPGALAGESQDTGDCTSHGTRNAGDLTRAVEIVVKGESDRYIARGATEYLYAGRGHGGQGMSPQKATKIYAEGQLLRKDYREEGGPDLRKYNAKVGMDQGRSGIPQRWQEIAEKELAAKKWIGPETLEHCLDCMAAGFGMHAGSQFGSSPRVGPDGLNRKTTSWNHDMAHAGYDLTGEIWREPVVFVPNSWAAWNQPNPVWLSAESVLGPWINGMLVVPLEDYERHIVRARSVYALAHIEGDAIKPLPLTSSGIGGWTQSA